MIVEGLTMYAYLKQPMSASMWALRETVLKLHDTGARITLFRAYREKTDYKDLRDGRTELVRELEANTAFNELSEDKKTSLRNGSVIFVGGMRRAAKEAGWNEDRFTAMYGYLSAHVHGAPMSYFRTREHGVDYYAPSAAQKAIAATAITIATACLRRASIRQVAKMDWRAHAVFAVSVDDFIADDAACDVFA